MERFLEFIGIGRLTHKFSDFEQKLKDKYIRNFIIDILFCTACIVFTIKTGYYKASAIFVILVIILLVLHIYSVLQLLSGKVYCFDGKVISDNKASVREKVLLWNVTILGESKLKIKYDGKIYTVPVGHASKYESGSTVRVYFTLESIMQISENEYSVLSPVRVFPVTDEGDSGDTDNTSSV